ncbi:transient-receptor-potential-like protein [Palaemon carinicauda]|uniref:transient-receptor-potential-like protein n=1 Tax=Palaemon carinicauda TaxID=392227 RepID=UPI0035B60AF8
MSYFDPGSTLPAPFNLIISPKAIFYCMRGFKTCIHSLCYRRGRRRPGKRKSFAMEKGGCPGRGSANKYAEVMRRLVSRYIHQTKKQHRQDGVNEDDLLEIKQDISSLRYELREDRKRETARAYGQMDSIKKDILRLLKQSGRGRSGGGGGGAKETEIGAVGDSSGNSIVLTTTPAPCPACAQQATTASAVAAVSMGTPGILQQHSVDLGMLGREPNTSAVDITVTPASSLPCNLTYSQGNLTGCLLAPQEMDYLRKEIVSSLRNELRDMLRDALARALTPTTSIASHYYSPTPTPNPTPQLATTPIGQPSPVASQQYQFAASPQANRSSSPPNIPQHMSYQSPSGAQYQSSSPTTELAPTPYLRMSSKAPSEVLDPRTSPAPHQSSPKSSPIPSSSLRSSPIPQLNQRPSSSCGQVPRSHGSPQVTPTSAGQVLLRPPSESDHMTSSHMYTQL